jgi:hypothetical protein
MSADFHEAMAIPTNPKDVALPLADKFSLPNFTRTQEVEQMLKDLEHMSEWLGFLGRRFFVECARSLVIPADTTEDEVEYHSVHGVMVEGSLVSYSQVSIGNFIGHSTVKALCLTFNDAILLPTFSLVDNSDLLHIPVYAIDSIVQVD